jgi:hypothetical protein
LQLGSDKAEPGHQLLAGASVSSEEDGEVWTTGFSITVQVGVAAGAGATVGCKEDGKVWTTDFAVTIEVLRTLVGGFAISWAAGGIFACIADSVTTDWAAAAFTLFSCAVASISVVAAEVSAVLLFSTVAETITNPRVGVAFASAVTVFDFTSLATVNTVCRTGFEAFACFADAVSTLSGVWAIVGHGAVVADATIFEGDDDVFFDAGIESEENEASGEAIGSDVDVAT